MPLPNHLLQSVEIPSVTHSRASGDYNPGNDQWKISHTSLLIWSLGIFPFKDDFWSTGSQTGCKYPSCVEPNPELETLVAALSAGPVGPSDAVGKINKDLVMKTCTASGLLLKADQPALPLDVAFSSTFSSAALLQVSGTFSQFGSNSWHYILAAELTAPFTITAADLGLAGVNSVVYDYFKLTNRTANVMPFDDTHPLQIAQASYDVNENAVDAVPFHYFVVAPVLSSGWILLGEIDKFVTLSHQRFSSIESTSTGVTVTLTGMPGETVLVGFVRSGEQNVTVATPKVGSGGSVTIHMP